MSAVNNQNDYNNYFTSSDAFVLLSCEKTYMQFFYESICHLTRKQQIDDLVSKLSDPDADFPFLSSIYYLMVDHEQLMKSEKHGKSLKFTFRGDFLGPTSSLVVIESGFWFLSAEISKPDKSEENVQHRMKPVCDLMFSLICWHFDELKYQAHHYPLLFEIGLNFCFRAIRTSLEKQGVNMRRFSGLLFKLYQLFFRRVLEEEDLEVVLSDIEKQEEFEWMKKLVEAEETGAELERLVAASKHAEVEEYYGSMMADASNPLPTVLVVGYLRALLNLVTTFRAKAGTGFDCTLELEATYVYMTVYMRDIQENIELYLGSLQAKTAVFPTSFMFSTLNLDKYNSIPELAHAFVEIKKLLKFKELSLRDCDLLPDSLQKILDEQNSKENKDEEAISCLNALLGESMTHRIVTINFMTATFSMLHKIFKANNHFQAVAIGNYIFEAKGILVMLKIIAEKILQSENPLDFGSFSMARPQALAKDNPVRFEMNHKVCPLESIVEQILYLFYQIIFDNPDIVNSCLNDFKAQSVFKKYSKMYPKNRQISNLSYLLIKRQLDLMPKKVKSNQMNMKILSYSYCLGKINESETGEKSSSRRNSMKKMEKDPQNGGASARSHSSSSSNRGSERKSVDGSLVSSSSTLQYLTSQQKEIDPKAKPGFRFESSHETVKKLCAGMNSIYLKQKDKFQGLIEQKKKGQGVVRKKVPTVTEMYNKLYSSVQIPDHFEEYYDKWLEKEVFGLIE